LFFLPARSVLEHQLPVPFPAPVCFHPGIKRGDLEEGLLEPWEKQPVEQAQRRVA
jgi:hypothetical protein